MHARKSPNRASYSRYQSVQRGFAQVWATCSVPVDKAMGSVAPPSRFLFEFSYATSTPADQLGLVAVTLHGPARARATAPRNSDQPKNVGSSDLSAVADQP